jgi:MFS transporter, FHS family, L-fucose permease
MTPSTDTPATSATGIDTPAARQRVIPSGALLGFCLIVSCFAAWGLAVTMTDTLLAAFKKIMSMTDFQTSWIQIAFFGAYAVLALPAALFIRKFSYKSGVLLGLGLFIAGSLLFYPASLTMQYSHFLIALFVLAGGISILETSADTYVLSMGSPQTATQRLNFAQSFNPVGTISGVLISMFFILGSLQNYSAAQRTAMSHDKLVQVQNAELSAVMGPYVGIACVLLCIWLAIAFVKMPAVYSMGDPETPLGESFGRLVKNKNYMFGVFSQFCYVGAQTGVWSFIIRYSMHALQSADATATASWSLWGLHINLCNPNERDAAVFYLISLICFSLMRFICTGMMSVMKPSTILMILSLVAAALCFAVMNLTGVVAVVCLVGISACMSLMFPTIFGLGASNLGKDTQLGGAGMIMAIIGGAFLTGIQGRISDATSIAFSFIIPLCCFLEIAIFGLMTKNKRDVPSAAKVEGR